MSSGQLDPSLRLNADLTFNSTSSSYPSIVNTTATVLLSSHYDSRGSFGSTRAPGGDDDGSGTMAILAIARTIARKGIKFHSNVQLVAFAGEEQGLLGSKAYARKTPATFLSCGLNALQRYYETLTPISR